MPPQAYHHDWAGAGAGHPGVAADCVCGRPRLHHPLRGGGSQLGAAESGGVAAGKPRGGAAGSVCGACMCACVCWACTLPRGPVCTSGFLRLVQADPVCAPALWFAHAASAAQVAGALQQAALGVGMGGEAFLATFNKSVPTALGLLGEHSRWACWAWALGWICWVPMACCVLAASGATLSPCALRPPAPRPCSRPRPPSPPCLQPSPSLCTPSTALCTPR